MFVCHCVFNRRLEENSSHALCFSHWFVSCADQHADIATDLDCACKPCYTSCTKPMQRSEHFMAINNVSASINTVFFFSLINHFQSVKMDLRWQRNKDNVLIFPIWQDIFLLVSFIPILQLLDFFEHLHSVSPTLVLERFCAEHDVQVSFCPICTCVSKKKNKKIRKSSW